MAMGSRTGKDPAMFTTATDDLASFPLPDPGANITMDILEQQQAKEQARLLHRFRELRQWQQKQQDQLMQQQQLQLEVLREEQLRVQMLIASQRGAQWGDGKVTRAEGFHKPSPLLMTPPHRTKRGVGIGAELAKTIMTVSTDSGLVTSMGDTLEQPQDSLPKPIMYPVSPSNDEDKYTNPELFSNPGSQGDELQSLDEQCRYLNHTDGGSDASSDSFILPPVPPDPKLARLATLGHGGDNLLTSLNTLQALLNNAAPNFLQQVLGLLPKEQQALLHERQQAVVEESASPTFSPVHTASIARQPARASCLTSAAMEQTSLPATLSSKSASQSEHHLQMQGHWEQPLLSDKHPFHQAQLLDRQPFHQPPLQQGQRAELRSGVDESALQRHLMLPESQGQDSFRYGQDAQVDEFAPRCKDLSPGKYQPPGPTKSTFQNHHKAQQQQRSFQQQAWQDRNKSPEEEKDEDAEDSDEELEVTVMAAASPDERPIKPGLQGKRTFEQLLEEQMASEQVGEQAKEEKEEKQEVHGSTKRPFLRKGEGIARFLKPAKRLPPKKSSSANQAQRASVPSRSSQPGAGNEVEKPSQQRKMQPRRQMDKKGVSKDKKKDVQVSEDRPLPEMLKLIKRRSEGGRKVQRETKPEVCDRVPDHAAESSADTEDTDTIPDDASFIARLRERQKTEPAEVEELEEFELLEDVADNMSLVSNSSVVARLVTPNKQRQKTAVSNLKSYLAQKMSASSPFERNAAIGNLMTSSSLQMPVSQPKEKKTEMNSIEEQDKVKSECIRHERDSSSDTLTDSSTDEEPENKGISVQVKKTERYDSDERENVGVTNGLSREVLTGVQERVSSLLFSSKFSFFNQEKSCSPESENSELKTAPSPTKSVTRKVATLHSRLAAANDTAMLLQRLSAHAGLLTSKFSTEQNSVQALEAAKDVSQHDVSGMSLNMPQPLLIGPKSTVGTDHPNNRTSDSEEEESFAEQMDGRNEHEKAKNKYSRTGSDGGAESGDDDYDDDDGGDNANALLINGSDANTEGITDNANINQNNNNSNNVEFDDEEEWTSTAPQATGSVPTDRVDSLSTPPTSKLMSRLFPKLKPKLTKAQVQQQQRFQLASNSAMGDGVQSKVLRDKLAELEAEIERFRNENAALEKLRREREEGLGKLKEEITRFEREKTEELKRLEEFKIQETKKLKQERKLFETYQKQVRAMPDKKEREEIDMLRTQLAELQEELKRKDGRWTSNVTRLKARIAELETENTELREEIKILERKRLQWVQMQGVKNAQVPPSKPQRSSTPTDMDKGTVVNGNHTPDVSTAQPFKPKGHTTTSQPTTSLALEVVANGTGYAGKTTFVPVTQSSGGESVPRAQPATPSMIEGVSLSSMTGHQGESADILARQGSLPIPAEQPGVDKGNRQYEEKQYPDGKVEHVYSNGSREVLFANGTRKEISSDGQYIVVSFFNGDIKQIFPDQRVVYYYAEAQTTHTTYPDKLEVLQFPNNQTEKHYPDGTKEIIFPDQTVKYLFPNGTEESIFQDGTIMRIDKNGERILEFPNGQREVHTQHYKRREYPDGTVKTLHNDGRQETRYSTGRLRLKDKDGNILLDKMC